MSDFITRGSTVTLSFVFFDENNDEAAVQSAQLELTYRQYDEYATQLLTLVNTTGNVWAVEWDSKKASPGWVDYHAHGVGLTSDFTEDGRFKLKGNRANLQHDRLPNATRDYVDAS